MNLGRLWMYFIRTEAVALSQGWSYAPLFGSVRSMFRLNLQNKTCFNYIVVLIERGGGGDFRKGGGHPV